MSGEKNIQLQEWGGFIMGTFWKCLFVIAFYIHSSKFIAHLIYLINLNENFLVMELFG